MICMWSLMKTVSMWAILCRFCSQGPPTDGKRACNNHRKCGGIALTIIGHSEALLTKSVALSHTHSDSTGGLKTRLQTMQSKSDLLTLLFYHLHFPSQWHSTKLSDATPILVSRERLHREKKIFLFICFIMRRFLLHRMFIFVFCIVFWCFVIEILH